MQAVNALARLHIYVGWFDSIPDTHEIRLNISFMAGKCVYLVFAFAQ